MTPVALDITVAVIILLSTIVAYMRGIIKEMFTIFGFMVAAFFAYKCGHLLTPAFNDWLNVPKDGVSDKADYVMFGMLSPAVAAKAYSFGGTFLAVLLMMTLLGRMFANWIKEAGMEMVDKGFGAMFGFARGFLVVFLVYVPFNYLVGADKFPDWAKDSYSVGAFTRTFDWISKEYKLDEKIKDSDEGVTIKFDKIDPEKIKEGIKEEIKDQVEDAKAKLKEEIEKEEQKSKEQDGKVEDGNVPEYSADDAVNAKDVPTKEVDNPQAPAPVIDKSGELSQ